jgi:hypothetical protein
MRQKRTKSKDRMLDEISARLGHSSKKFFGFLTQATGISKNITTF